MTELAERLRQHRKKYNKNLSPEVKRERRERYRLLHPEKTRAHRLLSTAVRREKIAKPQLCECCRRKRAREAHHHDYSKPLEVLWVCYQCHKDIHRDLKALGIVIEGD